MEGKPTNETVEIIERKPTNETGAVAPEVVGAVSDGEASQCSDLLN